MAAVITAADAALLARHLSARRLQDRLFFGLPEIRAAVAQALKKILPEACLPSVRKGAADTWSRGTFRRWRWRG
jgi:hypothetical protein